MLELAVSSDRSGGSYAVPYGTVQYSMYRLYNVYSMYVMYRMYNMYSMHRSFGMYSMYSMHVGTWYLVLSTQFNYTKYV